VMGTAISIRTAAKAFIIPLLLTRAFAATDEVQKTAGSFFAPTGATKRETYKPGAKHLSRERRSGYGQ